MLDDANSAASMPLPTAPIADLRASALFLDVDGTLIDFADRPDRVHVAAGLPTLLGGLAERLDGAFALISGRPLPSIDALFGLGRFAAAGLHGAEIRHGDGHVSSFDGVSTSMPALRARADVVARMHPGVFIEHKRNAIALHYRNAPNAREIVHAEAAALLREAGAGYELQPGNDVVELKPRGTNKGTAISALMREDIFAQRIPWVLGDDYTDEYAFEAVNAMDGISVIVGSRRPTLARYALPDPRAVHAWLIALTERSNFTARPPTTTGIR